MARDPKYTPATAGFADAIARMEEQSAASQKLLGDVEALASTERASTGATARNVQARLDAAAAIGAQVRATESLTGAIAAETDLLTANAASWERLAIGMASVGSAQAGLLPGLAGSSQRLLPQFATGSGGYGGAREIEARYGPQAAAAAEAGTLPSSRGYLAQKGAFPFVAGPAGGYPGQAAAQTQETAGLRVSSIGKEVVPIGQYSAAERGAIASNQALRASILDTGTAATGFSNLLPTMVSRFAGWAVAGGAVVAAFELIKKGIAGAEAGATGLAQLERASGAFPSFDKKAAVEGFAEVSKRINVSPAQAAEAQFFAARAGFHSQPESLKAGETALLAHKLDEVPIQDATKGLGSLHIAFGLNADQIRNVFNELDVGQLKFNARLNQTLPQMGRAASAFANAGGTAKELASQLVEVTGATGGGGGQGGGNPATFLLREAASNLQRSSAQTTLRSFGYDPTAEAKRVGKFNEELQNRAALVPGQSIINGKDQYLNDAQIKQLAIAIGGGGAQGGRYGVALLEAGRTGRAQEVREGLAGAGGAAQEDLNHKLAQINEQFAAVGHTLERVGLQIGSGGFTAAAEGSLSVLGVFTEALEALTKPLGAVGAVLGGLPPIFKDLAGAALLGGFAIGAGRAFKAPQGAVGEFNASAAGAQFAALAPNDFSPEAQALRAQAANALRAQEIAPPGSRLLGAAGAGFSGIGSRLLPAFGIATAGAFASELAGNAVGGKVGGALSSIGTDAAVGAALGFILPNPVTPVIGAGIGAAIGAADQLNKALAPALPKESKAHALAQAALSQGPLPFETGQGGESFTEFLGITESKGDRVAKARTLWEKKEKQKTLALRKIAALGGETDAKILSAAEGYAEDRELALAGKGEESDKASKRVESRNKNLAANAKFYAGTSQGEKVQKEIAAEASTSLVSLVNNPDQIAAHAENYERTATAGLKAAGEELKRKQKAAKSPAELEAAYKAYQKETAQLENIPSEVKAQQGAKLEDEQTQVTSLKAHIARVKAGKEGGDLTGLGAELKKAEENITNIKNGLQRWYEVGGKVTAALKETKQEEGEHTLEKVDKLNAVKYALTKAEAGKDSGALRAGELKDFTKRREEGQKYLTGEALQVREETVKKEEVEYKQRLDVEKGEKIEVAGAESIAKLPVGATKVQITKAKLSTAEAVLRNAQAGAKQHAYGWKELADARIKLDEAKKAVEEAINSEAEELNQAKGALAISQATGNRLAQAGIQSSTAAKAYSLAKTQVGKLKAQKEIVDASFALQAARQERISNEVALEESHTTNAAAQARIKLAGDRRLLTGATPDEKIKIQAGINRDKQALVSATVGESEERIEFQKTMNQISSQTAISELQNLLSIRGLTTKERDSILTKIRALQNEIGVGNNAVFNESPGKIKLPTAIDVSRALHGIQSAGSGILALADHSQSHVVNTITVNVNNHGDIQAVAEVLDKHTHAGVTTRLKSKGVIGGRHR